MNSVLTVISKDESVNKAEGTIKNHVHHQFLPNKLINGSPPSAEQFPEDPDPGGENLSVICDCHGDQIQNYRISSAL